MKKLEAKQMESIEGGVLICMEPVYSITGMCISKPCPGNQICIL